MTAKQILENLQNQHINIDLTESGLKASGSKNQLTPELRAELRANKEAIIFELRWLENVDYIKRELQKVFNSKTNEWEILIASVEKRQKQLTLSGNNKEEANEIAEPLVLLEWIDERLRSESATI